VHKLKRVNIKLKDEVHTKAKVISVLKDVTLNEYLESAIEQAIDRDKGMLDKLKKAL
jgi:predicted HicB family RNase H-like nuclease